MGALVSHLVTKQLTTHHLKYITVFKSKKWWYMSLNKSKKWLFSHKDKIDMFVVWWNAWMHTYATGSTRYYSHRSSHCVHARTNALFCGNMINYIAEPIKNIPAVEMYLTFRGHASSGSVRRCHAESAHSHQNAI